MIALSFFFLSFFWWHQCLIFILRLMAGSGIFYISRSWRQPCFFSFSPLSFSFSEPVTPHPPMIYTPSIAVFVSFWSFPAASCCCGVQLDGLYQLSYLYFRKPPFFFMVCSSFLNLSLVRPDFVVLSLCLSQICWRIRTENRVASGSLVKRHKCSVRITWSWKEGCSTNITKIQCVQPLAFDSVFMEIMLSASEVFFFLLVFESLGFEASK